MNDLSERELRGKAIIQNGVVPELVGENVFLVPSQSKSEKYEVSELGEVWACSCPDFKYRNVQCKHIFSVKYWLKMKEYLKREGLFEPLEEIYNKPSCVYCSSLKIVKNGVRKNKGEDKQRFKCLSCSKTFIANPEFRGFKADVDCVTLAMDLYFKGLSLRKIQDTIFQFKNVKIHHETVRRWTNKFMGLINDYTGKFFPETSRVWHSDEMMVKAKGKWLWAWNVLDRDTRFLLATNVTKERYLKDARKVLKEAKNTTKYQPARVVTDGLQSYPKAVVKELWTLKNKNTKHLRCPTITSKRVNNNRVERLNGTIRERLKVQRGFQRQATALQQLENFRTYYNFVRPHQALNGLTPAEQAGIKIPHYQNNKWKSLIKKTRN